MKSGPDLDKEGEWAGTMTGTVEGTVAGAEMIAEEVVGGLVVEMVIRKMRVVSIETEVASEVETTEVETTEVRIFWHGSNFIILRISYNILECPNLLHFPVSQNKILRSAIKISN